MFARQLVNSLSGESPARTHQVALLNVVGGNHRHKLDRSLHTEQQPDVGCDRNRIIVGVGISAKADRYGVDIKSEVGEGVPKRFRDSVPDVIRSHTGVIIAGLGDVVRKLPVDHHLLGKTIHGHESVTGQHRRSTIHEPVAGRVHHHSTKRGTHIMGVHRPEFLCDDHSSFLSVSERHRSDEFLYGDVGAVPVGDGEIVILINVSGIVSCHLLRAVPRHHVGDRGQ